METKYKIGNVVTVREDLEEYAEYPMENILEGDNYPFTNNVTLEMMEYLGKEAIITNVSEYGYLINLDDGEWGWTDGMFKD